MSKLKLTPIQTHLSKALEYSTKNLIECQQIIKQLTTYGQVEGQPIFIHPFDVVDLMGYAELNFTGDGRFVFMGKNYKETCNIPARTKDIQ